MKFLTGRERLCPWKVFFNNWQGLKRNVLRRFQTFFFLGNRQVFTWLSPSNNVFQLWSIPYLKAYIYLWLKVSRHWFVPKLVQMPSRSVKYQLFMYFIISLLALCSRVVMLGLETGALFGVNYHKRTSIHFGNFTKLLQLYLKKNPKNFQVPRSACFGFKSVQQRSVSRLTGITI